MLVSDGGPSPRKTTVWVMVLVLDENDNRPTFHEKVYQVKLPERERRKKAESIYRVFAYDLDDGPNSDLSYGIVDGNEDGKFFIDPKSGVVSSRKAFVAGSYDILTVRVHYLMLLRVLDILQKNVENQSPGLCRTAHLLWEQLSNS